MCKNLKIPGYRQQVLPVKEYTAWNPTYSTRSLVTKCIHTWELGITSGTIGAEGPQSLHIRGPSASPEQNDTQIAILYVAFEKYVSLIQ